MNWFKHKADTYDNYQMMEAFKKYGHIAYKFYFILHEIYAKDFDYHDQEEFVKISIEKLAKINNINKKNTEKLLKYFREKGKIIYKMEKDTILFKISDFKKLHNMWFERKGRGKNTKNITDIDVDIEIDVEEDTINEQAQEVLKFFNKATGKNYTDTRYIMPLLKKGKKYEDFCVVIMNKLEDKFFKENPKLITPRTLFKEELFDIYLNEGIEIREKKNEK